MVKLSDTTMGEEKKETPPEPAPSVPVSYTHLTLPTKA